MRGNEAGHAYRRGTVSPYIEFWKQPFLRWLLAWTYHYIWEKATEPVALRLSDWLKDQHEPGDEEYVSLINRRDIRCSHLSRDKKTTIAIVYITQEQYDVITGESTERAEEPRLMIDKPIDPPATCKECGGAGVYDTEWSDSADADPRLKALVVSYPEPPDGTVRITCPACSEPKKVEADDAPTSNSQDAQ